MVFGYADNNNKCVALSEFKDPNNDVLFCGAYPGSVLENIQFRKLSTAFGGDR
jgi:hypothetical protein